MLRRLGCLLRALLLLPFASSTPFVPSQAPNMNGAYEISPTPKAAGQSRSPPFAASFASYPNGTDFFDAYSPVFSTLYSQIWWAGLDPQPIPAAVAQRYAGGKIMAVVGFEVDQVMILANGTEISVPISVAYNHHFDGQMNNGKKSRLEKIVDPADPRLAGLEAMGGHRAGFQPWVATELEPGVGGAPTSLRLGGGNGGEYRRTWHGYPPGYVQVIESPTEVQITPMQIDTWHRDAMNFTADSPDPPAFVSGPVPRSSLAPTSGPGATYSGLLECPLTTRLTKDVDGNYAVEADSNSGGSTTSEGTSGGISGIGGCGGDGGSGDREPIHTAAECFAAAAKVLGAELVAEAARRVVHVTDPLQRIPAGCSATSSSSSSSSNSAGGGVLISIIFNTASPGAKCAAGATHRIGRAQSLVNLSISIGGGEQYEQQQQQQQQQQEADAEEEVTTLTLTGPNGVWFGVGLNASLMKDSRWTLVVDGHGNVTEHALGDHEVGGGPLPPSVSVVSSTVSPDGATRTVVLRAPTSATATGATSTSTSTGSTGRPCYFSFADAAAGRVAQVPFIAAVGSGPSLAYHKQKTAGSLVFLPVGNNGASDNDAGGANDEGGIAGGACICSTQPAPFGQGKGSLVYNPVKTDPGERGTATTLRFNNMCAPPPRGDLLAQRNPTCDVRRYTGGQIACHHMWSLLDADQPIPWPDKPLSYQLKFRFHYSDYDPSFHATVQYSSLGRGTDWSIGAGPMAPGYGAEYDVPKCGPGVAGCAFDEALATWVHTITGHLVIGARGSSSSSSTSSPSTSSSSRASAPSSTWRPVVAHLHCHAPTCLSMAVFRNDTGELLCEEVARYGQGRPGVRFDEPGYVSVPPCVWGRAVDGLEPPPDLAGVVLRVVKRANATFGHHGEMAHGEIYYVDAEPTSGGAAAQL